MAKENMITLFFLAFLAIAIGIGFLIDMAATTDRLTEPQTITAEAITMPAVNANVTLAHGNISTWTNITNSTGALLPATNYTVHEEAGKIELLDNKTTCMVGATCYTYYQYEANDYIDDDGANNMTTMIIVMFALGILGVIIGFIYPMFKEAF